VLYQSRRPFSRFKTHWKVDMAIESYRSRLPVGSGMGLTTSSRSLALSPELLIRYSNYMRQLGSTLSSRALPGDAFLPEDVFKNHIEIMEDKHLPTTPDSTGRLNREIRESVCQSKARASSQTQVCPTAGQRKQPLSRVAGVKRLRSAYPKETFVPRRIRLVEDLLLCWRDGDANAGCLFPLRLLQKAADRKRLISEYKNSWWSSLRHKDSLARYKTFIKEVVKLSPDLVTMVDGGTDDDWAEAIRRFTASGMIVAQCRKLL
jgi:hypothetical protein